MKKVIYFENLKFYHTPVLFYHILLKRRIFIYDLQRKLIKKHWLIRLHDLKLFSFIDYYIGNYDSLALEATEPLYNKRFINLPMRNLMIKLYESKDLSLAYKKSLARELQTFYAINLALKQEDESIRNNEEVIILHSYYYDSWARLLKDSNCFYHEIKHLKISLITSYFSKAVQLFEVVKYYLLFVLTMGLLLVFVLFKCFSKKLSQKIDKYRYIIPILYADYQLRSRPKRNFDFLLDHIEIRKDNVLFLILSHLTKDEIKKLDSEGYCTLRCGTIIDILKFDIGNANVALISKLLIFLLGSIPKAIFEPKFYIVTDVKLVLIFTLWSMILNRFEFKNFVCLNDHAETSIGRNILLSKHGCKTWIYAHANSFGFVLSNRDLSFYDSRNCSISFIYYDNYLLWNNAAVKFLKMHPLKVNNFINIGCLWSEVINAYRDTNAEDYLKTNNINKAFSKEYKVISFFDTTYSNITTLDMGIGFYNDIMRLLDEEKKIFVIIKEKKKHSFSNFSLFPSRYEYFSIIDKLSTHPRCYVANAGVDKNKIIAFSDLVISHAFTSPTVEALGARKRAFYYDPGNCRNGFHLDNVPGLVIHSYEELKNKTRQLLFEVSDEEYNLYLEKNILHNVEDYLDCKALTRFRKLLVKTE